eukprot:8097866-Karenia_brevis.AAC.1
MQGVSGSAVGSARGSASFGNSNLATDEEDGVVKLLRQYCGTCENQCPPNGMIDVVNGVSCNNGMRHWGMVEVGDADAHTYLPQPTECESLAGAELGTERKW